MIPTYAYYSITPNCLVRQPQSILTYQEYQYVFTRQGLYCFRSNKHVSVTDYTDKVIDAIGYRCYLIECTHLTIVLTSSI